MSGSAIDPDPSEPIEEGDVPVVLPPLAAGGGSGSAVPAVAVTTTGTFERDPDDAGVPEREARESGEDELGGSGGPAGGTKRP